MATDARIAQTIVNRYRDAFGVAGTIIGIGDTIKVIALVIGLLLIVGALIVSTFAGSGAAIGGIVSGVISGIFIYLCGVVVSAQGQLFRAVLDTAVNTSPFLDNGARATVMSLPLSTSPVTVVAEYQGGM